MTNMSIHGFYNMYLYNMLHNSYKTHIICVSSSTHRYFIALVYRKVNSFKIARLPSSAPTQPYQI